MIILFGVEIGKEDKSKRLGKKCGAMGAKVANLFQSFHRTFQPLKRVMESDFYSVIIFYFCLYTTRNYGKTHFYICLLATPFLHDVGAGNRAE